MPSDATPSNADLPISLPFRVGALPSRKPQRFDVQPDKAALALLAAMLDISAVRRLRFVGEVRASGRTDFVLEGELTAQVEQPCGITLVPVQTEIHEQVLRRYVADMPLPDAEEVEMPQDDTSEPLPEVIDAGAVLAEALALALPMYPRAPGAELTGEAVFGPPGVKAIQSDDLRPFAGLASLADRLKLREDDGSGKS
jgi:uncharacterized metal-binding protein YceD (DUF177 family)